MVTVLMSQQSCRHPDALTQIPYTLQQVLGARPIGKVTGLLECARRADGGAAILVASSRFVEKHGLNKRLSPIILGGGETSSGTNTTKLSLRDFFPYCIFLTASIFYS